MENFKKVFALSNKFGSVASWVTYLSALIFLCSLILSDEYKATRWWTIIDNLNVCLVVVITTLTLISNYFNFKGRDIKIKSMVDNGCGTNLTDYHPDGYYDNETVPNGLKKCALNLYESCYFSQHIMAIMRWKVFCKSLIIAAIVLVAIATNEANFIIKLIQVTIPVTLLSNLIIFSIVKDELDSICNFLRDVFEHSLSHPLRQADVIYAACKYESAMTWMNTTLSSDIYSSNNNNLTEEWIQIRDKYNV